MAKTKRRKKKAEMVRMSRRLKMPTKRGQPR